MIDSIFSGLSTSSIIVWACVMILWTAIQVFLNLLLGAEK